MSIFEEKNSLHSYATGRRKNAVARVFIKDGIGNYIINDKNVNDYFKSTSILYQALSPISCLQEESIDVYATVKGGGISGQAGAVKLGIARAILKRNQNIKSQLKKLHYLTRDSRMVERKKPGRVKARKRQAFKKR
jgi:small subunit ribosomal protein S9